jgi:hypothetical protein
MKDSKFGYAAQLSHRYETDVHSSEWAEKITLKYSKLSFSTLQVSRLLFFAEHEICGHIAVMNFSWHFVLLFQKVHNPLIHAAFGLVPGRGLEPRTN